MDDSSIDREAQLLALQEIDTSSDQLRYRRDHLPELAGAQQARADLIAWESAAAALMGRREELEALITASENESGEIDAHRTRLSAQLSTVIAVREAEALQSEIRTLTARREELDDAALAAMESLGAIDDEVRDHAGQESSLRDALQWADGELSRAQGDLDAELAALGVRCADLREKLPAELLANYDRLRNQLGVAVATLAGRRCEGCHMDLSPMEVDLIRATPPSTVAECPQCTRMLVRVTS